VHPLAEHQLANDEACLDRFTEANVIGNEEVHAWEGERLPKGLELVCHDLDPSAKGRLKERGICRGYGVPTKRIEIGAEESRAIEASFPDPAPALLGQDLSVDLFFPKDAELLPGGVIVDAAERDESVVTLGFGGNNSFD
jgi:hypothetical protein